MSLNFNGCICRTRNFGLFFCTFVDAIDTYDIASLFQSQCLLFENYMFSMLNIFHCQTYRYIFANCKKIISTANIYPVIISFYNLWGHLIFILCNSKAKLCFPNCKIIIDVGMEANECTPY